MKVQIELVLSHRATIRDTPTPDGFTHDWEVFVEGGSGGNIQALVNRVIFHLHPSFQNPKRVVKKPPFSIKESGYAGFNLNIEIRFNHNEEPKNVNFQYDLFLQSTGPPINSSRREKLIFNFPNDEFAKKIIAAGGEVLDKKIGKGATTNTAPPPTRKKVSPAESFLQLSETSSSSESSNTLSLGESVSKKMLPQEKTLVTKKAKKSSKTLPQLYADLFGSPVKLIPTQTNTTTTSSKSSSSADGKSGSEKLVATEKILKQRFRARNLSSSSDSSVTSFEEDSNSKLPPTISKKSSSSKSLEMSKSQNLTSAFIVSSASSSEPSTSSVSTSLNSNKKRKGKNLKNEMPPVPKKLIKEDAIVVISQEDYMNAERALRRPDSRSRTQSRSHSESISSSTSSSDDSDIENNSGQKSFEESRSGSSYSNAGGAGSNSNTAAAEINLLQELHATISALDDSEKLQEVVDIVEAYGNDNWTIEDETTFDFDLTKQNTKTIEKLKQVLLL